MSCYGSMQTAELRSSSACMLLLMERALPQELKAMRSQRLKGFQVRRILDLCAGHGSVGSIDLLGVGDDLVLLWEYLLLCVLSSAGSVRRPASRIRTFGQQVAQVLLGLHQLHNSNASINLMVLATFHGKENIGDQVKDGFVQTGKTLVAESLLQRQENQQKRC